MPTSPDSRVLAKTFHYVWLAGAVWVVTSYKTNNGFCQWLRIEKKRFRQTTCSDNRELLKVNFDESQITFQRLKQCVIEGQRPVVPFVGAGLSIYGPPETRLPLWGELVDRIEQYATQLGVLSTDLENRLRQFRTQGAFISALDILVNCIGEKHFRLFVEQMLDTTEREVPASIAQLVCISWSLIVTTNLDTFIERAWMRQHGIPLNIVTRLSETSFANALLGNANDPALAKIHGTLQQPESWVLTSQQYEWVMASSVYVRALETLFLRTVFFVGYGLSDADLDLLLANIRAIFPAGVGNSFALLPSNRRGTERVNNLIRDHGIQPIWYDIEPTEKHEKDCGHGQVTDCLQALVSAWLSRQTGTPVYLKYFPELDSSFVGRTEELDRLWQIVSEKGTAGVQIVGFGGEGKTSLAQRFLQVNEKLLATHFSTIFGFSFYRGDVSRFISDASEVLHSTKQPLTVGEQLSLVKTSLEETKVLLFLDGVEQFIDSCGQITNDFMNQIIQACLEGNSTLLVTSRRKLPYAIPTLQLRGLGQEDISLLLARWGIEPTESSHYQRFRESIGSHALSLRIAAATARGNLQNWSGQSVIEIPDEMDQAHANKAVKLLRRYEEEMSEDAALCMQVFSIFRRPVPTALFLSALRDCLGAKLPQSQSSIWELIEVGVLQIENGIAVTAHPLVREFFRDTTPPEDMAVYSKITLRLLPKLGEKCPATLKEALPAIDICHIAAQAGNKEVLMQAFYRTLNRRFRNHLGNGIGAWDEFLDIVQSALRSKSISWSKEELEYWHSSRARAFKHLGDSSSAAPDYLQALKLCLSLRSPHTARYANNFFDMTVMMGATVPAFDLMVINASTFDWISNQWYRLWQTEHGSYSFGHFSSLLGDFDTALDYFTFGDSIWERERVPRRRMFDTSRHRWSQVLLAMGPSSFDQALAVAVENLEISQEEYWPEAIARSHCSLATVYRYIATEADNRSKAESYWEAAREQLTLARSVARKVNLPIAWIELHLEELACMAESKIETDMAEWTAAVATTRRLLARTGFDLYSPEVLAAEGLSFAWSGDTEKAAEQLRIIGKQLKQSPNHLVVRTKGSLVSMFFKLIKHDGQTELTAQTLPKKTHEVDVIESHLKRVENFFG